MALAGLWESWRSPVGERVLSFAIITTTPNETCAELHDRMPVVLKPVAWPLWLGEEPADPDELRSLLGPYPSEEMTCWPVSIRVGHVKNNDPSLIEPITAAGLLILGEVSDLHRQRHVEDQAFLRPFRRCSPFGGFGGPLRRRFLGCLLPTTRDGQQQGSLAPIAAASSDPMLAEAVVAPDAPSAAWLPVDALPALRRRRLLAASGR